MAVRRTRKQKSEARHSFTISWNPIETKIPNSTKSASSEANVKRQFLKSGKAKIEAGQPHKNADNGVKNSSFAYIRFNLIRSIGISVLIVIIELVIYSFWK